MADAAMETPSKLRNARACEACRASKSRCVYKSEQGRCQRCLDNGTECVVRTKARPLRARATRASIDASQSPLDAMRKSPLNASQDRSALPVSAKVIMNLPAMPAPDTGEDIGHLHRHHRGMFDGDDDQEKYPPAHASQDPPNQGLAPQPTIQSRQVTLDEAERLLAGFKQMSNSFPFVVLPPDASVPSLARTSPFLLLGLLTVASIIDPPLHHQMNAEFKRILGRKVITEAQKSLDFLQGLLVYMAWYPIHMSPKNNQVFMFLKLAINMAVDLGLDRVKPYPQQFAAKNIKGLIEGDEFTSAAKKAYVGCYYLSSRLSGGFQKTSNLKYNDTVDVFCESLLRDEQATIIYALVKHSWIVDRISDQYIAGDPEKDIHSNSLAAELAAQSFVKELDNLTNSTDPSVRQLPMIGLSERFTNLTIFSHRLGFLRGPYKDMFRGENKEGAPAATTSHLFKCLDGCKSFFEYLLSLPESSVAVFNVAQWGQVIPAILVLTRLTFLMASELGWDAATTRANVPMIMYLDSLCWRFQQLTSTPPVEAPSAPPSNNTDIFSVFKMILKSLKGSYERRVAEIKPASFAVAYGAAVGPAWGRCPMRDPDLSVYWDPAMSMDSESTELGGSGSGNGSGSGSRSGSGSGSATLSFNSSVPVGFHDIWATMTGSWAKE